ncbi:glycosyltransferase family 2 protein [Caldicellulosiruptoraceae bacterium PP1]
MDLSIIIVNYNTINLLRDTLKSIFENPPKKYSFEVIVVDNNSQDKSPDMVENEFKNALLIRNKSNDGFSVANNIGIKKAQGKYILLLNSDTQILKDTLDKCLDFMEQENNKKIGILGCKVLLTNGKLDIACRRGFPTPKNSFFKIFGLSKLFPKNRFFAGYNLTYLDENKSYEVDSVVGAFMLIRKEVIEEIGLLDEDFFMFGEDIDYCFRAKKNNWKVYYFADAVIYHHKKGSGRTNPKVISAFYDSMWIFYKKHYIDEYPKTVAVLIYIAVKSIKYLKLLSAKLKSKRKGK